MIKILSWNVNGIRAWIKKEHTIKFIRKTNPTIICLQETRIDYNLLVDLNILDIFDKYPYTQYNPSISGRSGVLLLSKIKFKNIVISNKYFNSRVILVKFENFSLINVYVLNSGIDLKTLEERKIWNTEFLKLIKKQKNLIICGDFNVAAESKDIFDPINNINKAGYTIEERLDFKEITKIFIDIFRKKNPNKIKYTYFSYRDKNRLHGWRIDYFLIAQNLEKYVKTCKIYSSKILGSDHIPIELVIF